MGLFNAFFFLIQAGTKKMTGSNNAFCFGAGFFLGWVSSCLLMVNLKAPTTTTVLLLLYYCTIPGLRLGGLRRGV